MTNFEKLMAMPLVVAPLKVHSAKVLGSREEWLHKMVPIIFERFFKGEGIGVSLLAKMLGSKSANYAAGALQKHKGGADCFCTNNVPVEVRPVVENVRKLMPFLLDEDRDRLCESLGVDFDTFVGKLLELPSVVPVVAKEQAADAQRQANNKANAEEIDKLLIDLEELDN